VASLKINFEHRLSISSLSSPAFCGFKEGSVTAVGESSQAELKTRPDYSVTVQNALVGFVELKAPTKGADPRKFKDPHDKGQWEKLRSLPNLMYSDGNSFSIWQNGELVGSILTLDGDVEESGNKLKPPPGLLSVFETFLRWEPIPPNGPKELAEVTARLCRLLLRRSHRAVAPGERSSHRACDGLEKVALPGRN
jgi:hypothetical protein